MVSKELRIGNYTSKGVVYQIEEDCFYTSTDGVSYKNKWAKIHPIPLTPEILEAAGFVKTGRYAIGAGGYITYEKDRVVLLHPKKGHPFVLAFHETQVQSVHQLQNLYFALTGQELKINLT